MVKMGRKKERKKERRQNRQALRKKRRNGRNIIYVVLKVKGGDRTQKDW